MILLSLSRQPLNLIRNFSYRVPFTRNACITPGIQPKAVNSKLIKKVTPNPCFINTASGGKRIFNTIVRIDIVLILFG
ncbi:hypothetical protein GCM10011532_27690 [Christiangramia forsetii]|uniref:Uncharacterized protein n=1 Tax=Christiangramia forsetii TaxID=411153 RepID=A0ABQ1WUK6_9FLAO|nr:hypothetical protein GCM10011532_27690 [Christiangramia forsetii]